MTMNHAAIYHAYPQVVTINEGGAFDAAGNLVQLDQAKVDAAAVIVAQEQALAAAQRNRATAYTTEADPLFFKAQRGEATIEEWQAKVAEIRSRYPYPQEVS
jgi:hypothetical protein